MALLLAGLRFWPFEINSRGDGLMDVERLARQLDFVREADKIKQIFRQTNIGDNTRPENDSEHSWHLALMAMFLSEYANEEVDLSRVIQMVLIHDLVEIDAGDTYAYDPEANKSKREREVKAAERIFHILPDDQAKWLRDLWEEFEAGDTMDAKFAIAMDVLHPILMNDMGEGKAWLDHNVREEQVRARVERVRPGSETLYQVCSELITKNREKGYLI